MSYRVLIAEAQPMARQLFEILVNSSARYELAASVDNADSADKYCLNGGIDLILMGIMTRGKANGLAVAARIKRRYSRIKIIIVTSIPRMFIYQSGAAHRR